MAQRTVSQILATNLADAMQRKKLSQPALAELSQVPQTTISLILRPGARSAPRGKALASPTVERIDMLARALGVQAWQLLHPDPEQAQRETEFYERIRTNFASLAK